MPEQAAATNTKEAETPTTEKPSIENPTAEVKTETDAEVKVEKEETAEQKTATEEASKEETKEAPAKMEEKTAEDPQSKETLVITEEDLDNLQLDDNDDNNKITVTKEEVEPKKKPAASERSANIWVSNISRNTRANDLKQLFKKAGNVLKVRIVTNGQCFYGLVMMESAELAMECVKQFTNTMFKGKKIVVSKTRPDLLAPKEVRKKQAEAATASKKKEETKPAKSEAEKPKSAADTPEAASKEADEEQALKMRNLKRKYEIAVGDINKLKRDLRMSEGRQDAMRKKCKDLERQLERLRSENRAERRRLVQEKEEFEKAKKMHEIRMSADKSMIEKELTEVRRLRQHLNEKIDEFRLTTKKSSVGKRSRSPPRRMDDAKRYRSDDKMRSRDEYQRGRTPPPPPKLNDRKSNGRQYYEDMKPRSSDRPFDSFRDKQPYSSGPIAPRGSWPMSMPHQKEPIRRPMGGPGGVPSSIVYPPMDTGRYGAAYPPIPGVGNPVQPRPNFGGSQDYGKPYGGHY
ncbi:unnamed protein product [Callosobruchus maculatus]|uniref:RRM domain-containing protein n=1 Tax=Callosobruchus maculatus TaxID=64391 RepID=A0A653CS94_CALMS|nr:unnamed protein product [Callosobruchus maculatus]